MTVIQSLTVTVGATLLAEVRCQGCRRLLMKWTPTGVAKLEVKCPRCGRIDMLRLSTA